MLILLAMFATSFRDVSKSLHVGFLLLVAFTLSAKDKEDPRLRQVSKIFVTGNSRSANELRKALADLRKNTHWKNICISGVSNKDEADSTLDLAETVPLGGGGDGSVRLPSSSATITLKSGDLIWSNDSQYSSLFILKRLNDAVCRAQSFR